TSADGLRILHWHRHYDGECTARGARTVKRVAYTRVLVAEITWTHPLFGEKTARVLCTHFHHLTAKRERFAAAHLAFWDTLVDLCVRYGVRYIGGDFNMALYRVTGEARRRGLDVSLAASYAWRVTASDDVRYDSCGIFVVGPIRRTAPLLRAVLRPERTPAVAGRSQAASRSPSRRECGSRSTSAHSDDGFRGSEEPSEDLRTPALPPPTQATPTVVGIGGRNVWRLARDRPDVGFFGMYNGNWGGAKRNKEVLRHIGEDLIDGPAQLICAQEADPTVCESLHRGAFRSAETPTVVGDRRWHVLRGIEAGNTCMIAARVTAADGLRILHWHRHYDGEYTARAARTVKRVA
ncbi:MAG: hypothetical protein GY772_22140, partial [bacterium]|nr:hypothetical protein [bacterium]